MANGINKTVVAVVLIIGLTILGYGYLNRTSSNKVTEEKSKINLNTNEIGLNSSNPNLSTEDKPEAKIGEPAVLNGFGIAVMEAAWGEYDNKKMFKVSAQEVNLGKEDLKCTPPALEWKLVDKYGIAHTPIYNLKQDTFLNEYILKANQILPNQVVTGNVYFDIPSTIIPDYLLIQPCPFTTKTNKTIKIFLNY